jgi:hypothetical protein
VRPHTSQPWEHVLQLGQLYLHLCFATPRPRRKNVENELGPIHDPLSSEIFDVLPLARTQLVVEHNKRRPGLADAILQLIDFSTSQVRRGIGPVNVLYQFTDHDTTGRIHQPLELFEMLGCLMPSAGTLSGSPNEQDALGRG